MRSSVRGWERERKKETKEMLQRAQANRKAINQVQRNAIHNRATIAHQHAAVAAEVRASLKELDGQRQTTVLATAIDKRSAHQAAYDKKFVDQRKADEVDDSTYGQILLRSRVLADGSGPSSPTSSALGVPRLQPPKKHGGAEQPMGQPSNRNDRSSMIRAAAQKHGLTGEVRGRGASHTPGHTPGQQQGSAMVGAGRGDSPPGAGSSRPPPATPGQAWAAPQQQMPQHEPHESQPPAAVDSAMSEAMPAAAEQPDEVVVVVAEAASPATSEQPMAEQQQAATVVQGAAESESAELPDAEAARVPSAAESVEVSDVVAEERLDA